MTRVRRVAFAVGDFVVRYAPTGSDEWARGLRAELDVIDGDWAALGWALGSTRVLLRKPLYAEPYNWLPTALFFYYFVTQTSYALLEMRKSHGAAFVGDLLCCGGWLYFMVLGSSGWLRERARPDPADHLAVLLFQREGLERRLTRYRTVRRWFPQLAIACMCGGYELRLGSVLQGAPVVFAVLGMVAVVCFSLQTPGKMEERIANLDERIEQTRLTGR